MNLPPHIQEKFFETYFGAKSPLEFEQWLYANKEIESILPAEDYLDLVSLGYKDNTVKYELNKLLEKHIDKAEYEKWRLLKYLYKALQRDNELPAMLSIFYELYCWNYSFMDNLGLGYGLSVECPRDAETWEELSPAQQQDILNSFYPALEDEIKKLIHWLETGKVVVTGRELAFRQMEYFDYRTEAEKQPTAYKSD